MRIEDVCLWHIARWGLSYTIFKLSDLKLQCSQPEGDKFSATVTVTIKNCGSRSGSEVVQVYVGLPKSPMVQHPEKQLRTFKKVKDLQPGSSVPVEMQLDKYALAYWHEPSSSWRADSGEYTVKVGTSSNNLTQQTTFHLDKTFTWNGI
jgi:beta-glucosidase